METSVFDWMLAQKSPRPITEEGIGNGNDDVLVRILRSLDQMDHNLLASSS